jgi:hypothetical protein
LAATGEYSNGETQMKVRIAALVLTGILCAAAPAWSDTISGHSGYSATIVIRDSGEFVFHHALPIFTLRSSFADFGKFQLFDFHAGHGFWERWDRHRFSPIDPTYTTTALVATPEPSTLKMLELGLMGLLGFALFVSAPRSRRV